MSLQETRSTSNSNLSRPNPDNLVEKSFNHIKTDGINHSNTDLKTTEKIQVESQNDESKENNSTNPAAFTITFDDDIRGPKKFGLRDSIRKFAPPKPHTIEKPRPPKSTQSQDCSLNSIESSPGNFSMLRHRSSAYGSYQSQVSDSAKFLIDKMLNHDRASLPPVDIHANSTELTRNAKKVPELSDDKSDNGTYVIGTDPDTDAARSKIDELFGVIKAAEASITQSTEEGHTSSDRKTTTSSSRNDQTMILRRHGREPLDIHTKASHSLSSSPHEHEPRSSRKSRNCSMDRTSRDTSQHRPKRSASQASRHSSQREASDADTRSSVSSLQNFNDRPSVRPLNQPNMRFNRTVALRRARLGLGDPVSATPPTRQQDATASPSSGPRHKNNNQTMKDHELPSTFSRDDGGRYSLRSKGVSDSGKFSLSRNYQNSRFHPQVGAQFSSGPLNARKFRLPDSNRYQVESNHDHRNFNQSDMTDHGESDNDSTAQRFQYSLNAIDRNSTSSRQTDRLTDFGGMQYGSALDSLVVSAISSLSLRISHSVCDILVDQARKLPCENEVRQIVEETIPQLMIDTGSPRSSLVDRPLVCNDLSKTLKNLRKIEQMVDVIGLVSTQLPISLTRAPGSQQELVKATEFVKSSGSTDNNVRGLNSRRADDSDISPEINSAHEMSP